MPDPKLIEDKIDKVAAGNTEISMTLGGLQFKTMIEVMEFAKLMAISEHAIPVHLRNKPGACLGVCTRALRFGFDPYALAEHSYVTRKYVGQNAFEETLAFDSFVIHAIIEAHGRLTGSLRREYIGDGENRQCKVAGTIDGEVKEHIGPKLGDIIKNIGKNDKGKLKGSPLWITKPDQQLWYDARRDWCRAFMPQILLGWYDKDEFEENQHVGPENAKDITPTVRDRLKQEAQTGTGGFSAAGVKSAMDDSQPRDAVKDKDPKPEPAANKGEQHENVTSSAPEKTPDKPKDETAASEPQPGQAGETPATEQEPQKTEEAPKEKKKGAAPEENRLMEYSKALLRATQPKSLGKIDTEFRTKFAWTTDLAAKEKLTKIYSMHLQRINSQIDVQQLEAEVLKLGDV